MFSFFKKKLGSPPSITPAAQAATAAQPGTPDAVPAVLPPPATSPAGATIAPAVASAPDRIATSRMRPAAAQPGLPEAVGLADSPTTSASVGAPAARQGWMDKLKAGLRKTGSSIAGVFTGAQIDDALYEDLETALLMADTGVKATAHLLADLKFRVVDNGSTRPSEVKGLLVDGLAHMLSPLQKTLGSGQYAPTVIMVTGVNGAGKTTSIGKLTRHLADSGASVLLAAADTFRAAAREQLGVWADRNTVDIISQDGGDPAAVSFDAVSAGKARGRDVVLIDTAGRLPTQLHLMEELKKIKRVIQKTGAVTDRALATGSANPLPGSGDPAASSLPPHEILLVIDGNTGQNALNQVKAFDDALGLTGLIVTKLDGTAKGGVLAAIARERPIPVYFIGVGEKLEDLETFNAREFAQALLS